jgi:hypothetical protein
VTDHLARAPVAGATRALRRDRLPDGTPAVVKVVHQGEGTNPRWRSSTDEGDPYYWKREPLAYTTGFLAREFEGVLRAPALQDDAGAQRLATKYGEPFATIRYEWEAAMAFMAERAAHARASATSRRSAG